MRFEHQPVFLNEALNALAIKKDGIYIDATLGRGGHSKALLQHLGPAGRLIVFDKDLEAIEIARENLASDDRVILVHGSFNRINEVASRENVAGLVNGILFDLGVSSPQLDNPQRGFSFLQSGPLDMRMDNTQGRTAAAWLAVTKESEIAKVLHDYGEERFARRIANAIVRERAKAPINTTAQLAEIVSAANPAWEKGKHPATRTFQAIRIFINQELSDLQIGLEQAFKVLAISGRLVVISFHSLEDRLVKQFMRQRSQDERMPREIPIRSKDFQPQLKCLGRAIRPTMEEIAANPRARSAVLRVAEKLTG